MVTHSPIHPCVGLRAMEPGPGEGHPGIGWEMWCGLVLSGAGKVSAGVQGCGQSGSSLVLPGFPGSSGSLQYRCCQLRPPARANLCGTAGVGETGPLAVWGEA